MIDWLAVAKVILGPAMSAGARGAQWTAEQMFGPKHVRELVAICERTLDEVVAEAPELQSQPVEVRFHVRGLVTRAVELIPDLGVVSMTTDDDRGRLVERIRADVQEGASDLDPETTPSIVLELLARFVSILPNAVLGAAKHADSMLHNYVVVSELEQTRQQVTLLASTLAGASRHYDLTEHERRQIATLNGAGLPATLAELYPEHPQLELFGAIFPISIKPALAREYGDLESAKAELVDSTVPAVDEYPTDYCPFGRDDFAELRRDLDQKRRWNAATFALDSLTEVAGQYRFTAKMGRYFLNLATSDALDEEMMSVLAFAPDRPVRLAQLRRRHLLHQKVADPITDGSHRSAALSVATSVVVRTAEGYSILVSPRSGDVARHRYFNHVAPSGIFQPHNVGTIPVLDEYNVELNLLREYVEELYAVEEIAVSRGLFDHVRSYPEVTRLDDLVARDRARLFYTGLSVNLLMLRVEVCTMLYIDDIDWLANESRAEPRRQMLGWEYTNALHEGRLPPGRRLVKMLRLDKNLEPLDRGVEFQPSALVPNAAAAIALALPALRTELARRNASSR